MRLVATRTRFCSFPHTVGFQATEGKGYRARPKPLTFHLLLVPTRSLLLVPTILLLLVLQEELRSKMALGVEVHLLLKLVMLVLQSLQKKPES